MRITTVFSTLAITSSVLALPNVYQLTGGNNAVVWFSMLQPTIFGMDATDHDYIMAPAHPAALEALDSYAEAVRSGDQHRMALGFYNASRHGRVTKEEAKHAYHHISHLQKRKGDLQVIPCIDHMNALEGEKIQGHRLMRPIEWEVSKKHQPSNAAVLKLYELLRQDDEPLPCKPRSICTRAEQQKIACVSWSKNAKATTWEMADVLKDAMEDVNFDEHSAHVSSLVDCDDVAFDMCISDRAKGCGTGSVE